MQAVQDAIERRPGPKMTRSLRAPLPAPLDLPVACKGQGCQIRDRFKQVAEKCKKDLECIRNELGQVGLARDANGRSNAAVRPQ